MARLRYVVYDDSTTHSTMTEVIEITIRLRYDYDVSCAPVSIRREQKINMSIFVVVVS